MQFTTLAEGILTPGSARVNWTNVVGARPPARPRSGPTLPRASGPPADRTSAACAPSPERARARWRDPDAVTDRVRKPRDEEPPVRDDEPMDLDPDACYRAIATRDARFDGRLFIAVKTTGIYCRPICPARTPEARERRLLSDGGGRAGGRLPPLPALPARDARPTSAVWRGTSNTVSRALALIEKGALDGADVEALAERLGVGERQLRRLFRQHLGASPIAVAQTRRVLLAKQLIHETRLPMTEVALAAGFGSVRRFNETFQQLFGRPPSTLRRGGAAGTSRRGRRRGHDPAALPPALRLAGDARVPAAPARFPASRRCRATATRARSRSAARTARSRCAPPRGNALRATIQFPRLSALPDDRRAPAPRVRPRRRPGGDRRAPGGGSRARAAGRGPAGPARAGRVGRLRAGGARRARPADHGDGRAGPRGQARRDATASR